MALVLLSGGPGEELVAEPLASAARVPYQTTSAMVPSQEPSQARDEGTKIDGCRSLPGDRRARGGDRSLALPLVILGPMAHPRAILARSASVCSTLTEHIGASKAGGLK